MMDDNLTYISISADLLVIWQCWTPAACSLLLGRYLRLLRSHRLQLRLLLRFPLSLSMSGGALLGRPARRRTSAAEEICA